MLSILHITAAYRFTDATWVIAFSLIEYTHIVTGFVVIIHSPASDGLSECTNTHLATEENTSKA